MLGAAKKAYHTVRGPLPPQTTQSHAAPPGNRRALTRSRTEPTKSGPMPTQGGPASTRTMRGHADTVWAIAFFKDGRQVVTGSRDHTLRHWDVQKGESVGGSFGAHSDYVRSVAVSPDNKRIASGGSDKTVIIWDVESRQKMFEPLVKHTNWVYSVCFSPDGKRLASGSSDRTVVFWDAETGTVLATLPHPNMVLSVAFSPDGQKLASGSVDCTIRIWCTDDAEQLLEIRAHEHWVRSVVWSPDGQQIISASHDQTVKFWNSSNGAQIGQPCIGHTRYVNSLAISSDGSYIATSSDDKTVRIWSTKTHQHIGQALEHATGVHCVAISPNGELLVSGDGQGRVWLRSIKDILEQGKEEEKRITEDEEAQRRRLHRSNTYLLGDTQMRRRDNSSSDSGYHDRTSSHSSISSFDILTTNSTIRDACIAGDLDTAADLLTKEIDADGNNYNSYANRSVVRARHSEWGNALRDAVKSIAIQPSPLGYISKGIALCGSHQHWNAMEAFDLASTFSNYDQITIDFLLLIKAVALFNSSRHEDAMRRVGDLATAYQHSDSLPCSVVNRYLRVQLGMIAFENGRYSEAADKFKESIPSLTDFFSRGILFEPRLKIFTVLFGWDLDSLWQTVNQRRCDACLHADRVTEAVQSYQYMMRIISEDVQDSCLEWSTAFIKNCTARCVAMGDEAAAAGSYERAIELYSAGIELDSSCESLFAHRSKANLAQNLYAEALHDADRVIELNSSSHLGYELKYATLHGAHRYNEAIEAFKTMLLKSDDSSDPQIRELRHQYVSQSEVEDAIRKAIHARLENAPLRLLDTLTGRICTRQVQINIFQGSTEYQEVLSSSINHPHLELEPIEEVVEAYFHWVMLSHRWEPTEPVLHDIQDKAVYDFEPVGTIVKLQTFCETARDAGYRWAWSDTCCIDQSNNVEVQRSVNSMFGWYRQSALTIVYLSDVPPSSKSGALAESVWNTRGWTVQEFLAPRVVRFYQADWTPYLNDRSPNHKESVTIMQELQDSTDIDARSLATFSPGMRGAREKLHWASTRVTTLQEDIAYSLFGIFGVHLPVIYGETKQNALGRLLQEIVGRTGDITALDWVGKSSEFNSCLPADITSYKNPPCTLPSLSEDEMQASVSTLQNTVTMELALKLYTLLDSFSAPRFANSRLHLPCIVFPVTEIRRRRSHDPSEIHFTYEVKADGLQTVLITTDDKLAHFSRAKSTRQPFFIIRPWSRHDLESLDLADEIQSLESWSENWSESHSPSDESSSEFSGENEPVDPDPECYSRALRLIVRLGQPFGALLLKQQGGGEYKRIASDHNIIAQVRDVASVHDMMDVRTLEIL